MPGTASGAGPLGAWLPLHVPWKLPLNRADSVVCLAPAVGRVTSPTVSTTTETRVPRPSSRPVSLNGVLAHSVAGAVDH
jgi:hypothetical protein